MLCQGQAERVTHERTRYQGAALRSCRWVKALHGRPHYDACEGQHLSLLTPRSPFSPPSPSGSSCYSSLLILLPSSAANGPEQLGLERTAPHPPHYILLSFLSSPPPSSCPQRLPPPSSPLCAAPPVAVTQDVPRAARTIRRPRRARRDGRSSSADPVLAGKTAAQRCEIVFHHPCDSHLLITLGPSSDHLKRSRAAPPRLNLSARGRGLEQKSSAG